MLNEQGKLTPLKLTLWDKIRYFPMALKAWWNSLEEGW